MEQKLYRIDNDKLKRGLWRTFDGEYKPLFNLLSDGKCKDVPMPHDDKYHKDGIWFASTDKLELLHHWFSIKDIEELNALGFKIKEYTVTSYKKLSEYECIFKKEDVIEENIIPIYKLYTGLLRIVTQITQDCCIDNKEYYVISMYAEPEYINKRGHANMFEIQNNNIKLYEYAWEDPKDALFNDYLYKYPKDIQELIIDGERSTVIDADDFEKTNIELIWDTFRKDKNNWKKAKEFISKWKIVK